MYIFFFTEKDEKSRTVLNKKYIGRLIEKKVTNHKQ